MRLNQIPKEVLFEYIIPIPIPIGLIGGIISHMTDPCRIKCKKEDLAKGKDYSICFNRCYYDYYTQVLEIANDTLIELQNKAGIETDPKNKKKLLKRANQITKLIPSIQKELNNFGKKLEKSEARKIQYVAKQKAKEKIKKDKLRKKLAKK